MQITSLKIDTFSGGNCRPNAGSVTFSDGKTFGWSICWDTKGNEFVMFDTIRRTADRRTFSSFRSAKRSELVLAAINA